MSLHFFRSGIVPRLAVLLAFGALPLRAAGADNFRQSADEVDRYDFVEVTLTLDAPPRGNPFVDASFSGEFGPGPDDLRKVEGFCDSDDGRVFRIRFMPTRAGKHTYAVRLRAGDTERAHSGEFTARDGRRPGLLRVDREYPAHFVFEGSGRHFFWNATTTYWLLGWRDDATINESLDRLARLKVNRVRVALSGRTRDGMRWREPDVVPGDAFQMRLEPWPAARPADIENPGYDVSRFNLAHFRKAERMLRHAAERNIQVSLIFHLDGADKGVDPFGKAGMGGPDEQRYYRYCIARFAAFDNVMWDVTNEWHLFRDEPWVEKMGALIKQADPYGHLLSVHGKGEFPFRRSAWVDYVMFQSWDEWGSYDFMLKNRREQAATGRPLPQINEEYGYEDHYPYPWGSARKWPARTADNRRRLAWEMTLAGAYQTTGERANVPGCGGWVTGRGDDTMTMLAGYAHILTCLEGMEWWKLEPSPELLVLKPEPPLPAGAKPPAGSAPPTPALNGNPLCLARPGEAYVVYLPRGGSVKVKLADGAYATRWFNPRTGEWLAQAGRATGGEWTSPPAPDAEDWVLVIRR